jgi:1-deoxy-D-xylulose-5-phosphate synthase
LGVKLDTELHEIPIGKWEILRDGDDVTILAIGSMVAPAIEAARELAVNKIDATVVNARFAKPLDVELIADLACHVKVLVTVEENALNGGFGSNVSRFLHEIEIYDVKVRSLGIPDEFVEQGTQAVLRARYNLDANGIVRQVKALFPDHETVSPSSLKGKIKTVP